jgi:hypothetical protein
MFKPFSTECAFGMLYWASGDSVVNMVQCFSGVRGGAQEDDGQFLKEIVADVKWITVTVTSKVM